MKRYTRTSVGRRRIASHIGSIPAVDPSSDLPKADLERIEGFTFANRAFLVKLIGAKINATRQGRSYFAKEHLGMTSGCPTNWTQSASHLCLSSKLSAMIGGAFFELRVAKGMRRKPNAQTA